MRGQRRPVIRISDGAVVETVVAPPDQFHRARQYGFASWSPNGRMILLEDLRTDQLPLGDAVFSLEGRSLGPAPLGRGRLLWVGPQELVRTSIPSTSFVLQSPDRRLALTLAILRCIRGLGFADWKGSCRSEGIEPERGVVAGLHSNRLCYRRG
jgi:hypothetical protein